jgi:alkyl hydroperoxide reductase subunit AhpC
VVDRIARRFLKQGVVVIGVNGSDAAPVIRAYATGKQLGYPMVLDPDSRVAQSYAVDRLPTLVVIDKAGQVRASVSGLVDETGLSELLLEAL